MKRPSSRQPVEIDGHHVVILRSVQGRGSFDIWSVEWQTVVGRIKINGSVNSFQGFVLTDLEDKNTEDLGRFRAVSNESYPSDIAIGRILAAYEDISHNSPQLL